MTIFYSFSNHRETTHDTYIKISERMNNLIIDVDRNDKYNSNQLLEKIKNHIDSSLLFICDITPDIKEGDREYANPNVMIELGYALNKFGNNNIILLINKNISKIPSMLKGLYYIEYDIYQEDYYEEIINKIKESYENIKDINWTNFQYKLTQNFINSISSIININNINYDIRINKTIKKAVILFNNNKDIKLNIFNKELSFNNKIIYLSNFENIYNELKHLELIISFSFLDTTN